MFHKPLADIRCTRDHFQLYNSLKVCMYASETQLTFKQLKRNNLER